MARTITVNSITNGVVSFTITGAAAPLNRTYIVDNLPTDSKASFLAAVRAHLLAYAQGLQSAVKPTPAAEVTSISGQDVDQGA